jgi:hypothetical protein
LGEGRYIATIAGQGYSFVALVSRLPDAQPAGMKSTSARAPTGNHLRAGWNALRDRGDIPAPSQALRADLRGNHQIDRYHRRLGRWSCPRCQRGHSLRGGCRHSIRTE